MRASRTELPISEQSPSFEGRYAHWGDHTVGFEIVRADLDAAPLFKGLPDDACQSRHWGYCFKGEMRVRYVDGHEETITTGQAYYLEPGHVPWIAAGSEFLELSPTAEVEAQTSGLARIRETR